jgi:hypothetical protein
MLNVFKRQKPMFYVIAEARLGGGRLRNMYVRYASDTSVGGHILWTANAERSYSKRDASALLASVARESPEWGFRLQPV